MLPVPQIGTDGAAPQFDGQINQYVSPEVVDKSWYNPAQTLIHVNGIRTPGESHRDACMSLSLMHGARVLGVYNATALGGSVDLLEAIADKLTLALGQAGGKLGIRAERAAVQLQMLASQLVGRKKISLAATVDQGLEGNKATQSLYRLLMHRAAEIRILPLHLHSQGNLIGSNALTAVAIARGTAAISGARVYSYGSPATFWPAGISKTEYAFDWDLIVGLSMDPFRRRQTLGYRPRDLSFNQLQPLTHGFAEYMAHDGGFIVQRFVNGASLSGNRIDGPGLAGYLRDHLSQQPHRIIGVLEHIRRYHTGAGTQFAQDYVHAFTRARVTEMHRGNPGIVDELLAMMGGQTGRQRQDAWQAREDVRSFLLDLRGTTGRVAGATPGAAGSVGGGGGGGGGGW